MELWGMLFFECTKIWNLKIQKKQNVNITGTKTSRSTNEYCSHDAEIRDIFGANRFLVKLLETGPYFVNHLICDTLDFWIFFRRRKSLVKNLKVFKVW